MAPTMTTRNDGRRTATRRGRRTDGQTGRGDGRTGDQGGQGGDRGNRANGGVNKVPDFATVIAQQLQDLFPTIVAQVKKMEVVQEISGCEDNHKVKYSTGSLTGRALTWWSSEVKTRGQEAAFGMTWEDFKALMKEEYRLSNEMQKLETEF
ncbi:reverse transcriptase domain-containing protein [Tanacetum coccineum]